METNIPNMDYADLYNNSCNTNMFSHTIYAFNLDDDKLSITDYDIVRVGLDSDERVIPVHGILPIKHIQNNSKIQEIGLFKLEDEFNFECPRKSEEKVYMVRPVYESSGSAIAISLEIEEPVFLAKGTSHSFCMIYDVPMNGPGKDLFFTGAIQPTDYDGACNYLQINHVSKKISIHAWSLLRGFSSWLFSGSNIDFHPNKEQSHADADHSYNKIEKHLIEHDILKSRRARYFSLFIKYWCA